MPIVARITMNLLTGASAKMHAQADALVETTANEIVTDAQSRVAVDTGETQENIRISVRAHGSRTVESTRPSTDADFSVPMALEYGTTRMPAQPYFTPAVETARSRFMDGASKLANEAVR